jgi:hypothetical protein
MPRDAQLEAALSTLAHSLKARDAWRLSDAKESASAAEPLQPAVPQESAASSPPSSAGTANEGLSGLQVEASLEDDYVPSPDHSREPVPGGRDLSFIPFYVYAEIPLAERPPDIVLESLKGISVGTPVEEIKRAAEAFRMNFNFMKAVAKIESDFDPRQRTGSYIGLFQLSRYEFARYGSGDIMSPRDNAIAAAYKFLTEAALFEWDTHKQPTFSDLYLIHQQGWQGAAEHVAHPERIAWRSMCATDEGKEKGEKWCKRAVWGNTLPAIKHLWKSVDNLTSGAFVTMWRQRVDSLYARYSAAEAVIPK